MSDTMHLIARAQKIMSAYVINNYVTPEELSNLLPKVLSKLKELAAQPKPPPNQVQCAPARPAMPIAETITPDYIICLENGKKFKSLKRHLWAYYKLTPDEYRKKWGLPRDYPMVAPNYSERRRQISSKRY